MPVENIKQVCLILYFSNAHTTGVQTQKMETNFEL